MEIIKDAYAMDTRKPKSKRVWKEAAENHDPLTREEFGKKYWMEDRNAAYQFWVPDIADGRNELEQLILNDIRSLYYRQMMLNFHRGEYDKERAAREKKAAIIQRITAACAVGALALAAFTARHR